MLFEKTCNMEMMGTLKLSLMGKSPIGVASNCCCGLDSLTCTPDTVRWDSKSELEALAEGYVIDAVG